MRTATSHSLRVWWLLAAGLAAGCAFHPIQDPPADATPGAEEDVLTGPSPDTGVSPDLGVAPDLGAPLEGGVEPDAPVDAPMPTAEVGPPGDATVPPDACTPLCTAGAKRCGTGGGLQTCVSTNGCTAWSAEVACMSPMTCQGSSPSAACACPGAPAGCVSGQGSFCESSTVVATCATDALGCVKIASRVTCAAGKPCTGNHPSASCSCPPAPPECSAGAGASCQGNTLVTCAVDSNGCISVSTRNPCPSGRPCMGTAPNAACTCPAPPAGCNGTQDRFCESSSTVAQCGLDSNGCLAVTQRTTCPGGKPCMGSSNAACTCLSPPAGCAGQSGTFCESGSSVATCGINSSNGCLDIVGRSNCISGKSCTGAAPNAQCTCPGGPSDCSGPGNVCRANNTLATCGFDGNGCLTTTSSAPCGAGKTCSGGFPGASCVSSCPTPPSDCNGAGKVCRAGNTLATCTVDGNGCVSATTTTCPSGKPCAGAFPNAACTCPAQPSDCSGPGTVCRGNVIATCGFIDGCLVTTNATGCTGTCTGSFPSAACQSNPCGPNPTCDNGSGCPCSTTDECSTGFFCKQPGGAVCNTQSNCTCQAGCIANGAGCLNADDCCQGSRCLGTCMANTCRPLGQKCHSNQDCCIGTTCVFSPPGHCYGTCS